MSFEVAPRLFSSTKYLLPYLASTNVVDYQFAAYKRLFSVQQRSRALSSHLNYFLKVSNNSPLSESVKISALYLSLDQTGQSLPIWSHPSPSVEANVKCLLQVIHPSGFFESGTTASISPVVKEPKLVKMLDKPEVSQAG